MNIKTLQVVLLLAGLGCVAYAWIQSLPFPVQSEDAEKVLLGREIKLHTFGLSGVILFIMTYCLHVVEEHIARV